MTRDEAVETIKYASAFNHDNSPLTKALDMAMEALKAPERKYGRWERISVDKAVCTKCLSRRNIETQFMWSYCPRCGAKMDKDEDETP